MNAANHMPPQVGTVREWMDQVRVLDGGFGTEAASRSPISFEGHVAWSSRLLLDYPNIILDVHKSFLEAGAQVIGTNTYQAEPSSLAASLDISLEKATDLLVRGVQLAQQAREEVWKAGGQKQEIYPLVAGCLGPYGSHLGNRSEYTGHYLASISIEQLMAWHRPRLAALVRTGVDLIAWETVPGLKEVEAMLRLMREFPGVPAWISVNTLDGQRTVAGDDLAELSSLVDREDQIFAMGVNCAVPLNCVATALQLINSRRTRPKLLLAYPNSGEVWAAERTWHFPPGDGPDQFIRCAPAWVKDGGARWLGGCCRIGPQQIAQLRAVMDEVADVPQV